MNLFNIFPVLVFFLSKFSHCSGNLFGKGSEYFDLSYHIDETTLYYPGQRYDYEQFRDIEGFNRTAENVQYWFAMYSFCMGEHGGTHVDSPYHFNKNGWKLGDIPLQRLIDIPTAIIDVEDEVFALEDPSTFKVEVRHLLAHEAKFGRIPSSGLVFAHFGWGRFWPNRDKYFGVRRETGPDGKIVETFNFPGYSGDAAKWLLHERHIIGIGTDSASVDVGKVGTKGHVVHLTLSPAQVYNVENLANTGVLLKMTQRGRPQFSCNLYTHVLPVKTQGTGGPARIISYCKN